MASYINFTEEWIGYNLVICQCLVDYMFYSYSLKYFLKLDYNEIAMRILENYYGIIF